LLSAIIDGNLKEAELIKDQSKRSNSAHRMEKHRRRKGIISRSEYLEKNSTSRVKPWEQEGVSRASWYRHK
jgi:hypothetical protein